MKRIQLVGDLVLWEFPELTDLIVKELSRAGTVVIDTERATYLDLTIRLPGVKPLCVYSEFDIYNKANLEKSAEGILVDPENWKVVNNRLPDIYFRDEPKNGALDVFLRIYLEKILHGDERHHVGKDFYKPQFCWFAISLMRGVYFLIPRKH